MNTRKRLNNSEELPISKRRRQEEEGGSNWSDLPYDIFENIIRRLRWVDRIRIQAVCRAWSIANRNTPAPIGEVPWAMFLCLNPTYYDNQIQYNVKCRLLDPVSQKHVATVLVREEYAFLLLESRPLAFKYGWILYEELDVYDGTTKSLFLYSPFTNEVIKLPRLPESFEVATFSLDANSPRCVVFLLKIVRGKICVSLCSLGDNSWKTFHFNGFDELSSGHDPFYATYVSQFNSVDNLALDAAYANGVFYCLFQQGQLGAFNLEREEWTLLVYRPLPGFCSDDVKLIASDVDLGMLSSSLSSSEPLMLRKLDFSQMDWACEHKLKNHVSFIGCTSFSVAAVGETSKFANTLFSTCWSHPSERYYSGCTFYSEQRPYHKCDCVEETKYQICVEETKCEDCVEGTKYEMHWIELPLGGVWRANDLIHAPTN